MNMKNLVQYFNVENVTEDNIKALLKDAAYNSYQDGVTQEEANKTIRTAMLKLFDLAPEDLNNKKLVKRALKHHKDEFFEVIEDIVDDMLVTGWSNDPFFMQFVDMHNIADGDSATFVTQEEVMLTTALVSGDHHDIMLQRLGGNQNYTVTTSTYAAAVGTDIRLFLTGRKDWAELVNAVYKAFDKKVKDTVYAEVMNVGDKLPVASMFNKAMAISKETKGQLDELIENVSAANDNSEVVIMGTSSALAKLENLVDVNWISANAKNEKYETGRLGLYQGTSLVEVPQRLARKGSGLERMIDSNKLFVMPVGMDKFVKFVNAGDAEIIEVTEKGARQDDMMTFEYQQSFGVATVVGKYFGAIKITA